MQAATGHADSNEKGGASRRSRVRATQRVAATAAAECQGLRATYGRRVMQAVKDTKDAIVSDTGARKIIEKINRCVPNILYIF